MMCPNLFVIGYKLKNEFDESVDLCWDKVISIDDLKTKKLHLLINSIVDNELVPTKKTNDYKIDSKELLLNICFEDYLSNSTFYKKANVKQSSYNNVKGKSLVGIFFKRIYVFAVKNNWHWIPRLYKRIGKFFIKIGEGFFYIDLSSR